MAQPTKPLKFHNKVKEPSLKLAFISVIKNERQYLWTNI